MTVRVILQRLLERNGYDGLTDGKMPGDCSCLVNDLMPDYCYCEYPKCVPGYKVRDRRKGCESAPWRIVPGKARKK